MKYDYVNDGMIDSFDLSCAFRQVKDCYERQKEVGAQWNYDPKLGRGVHTPGHKETDEELEKRLWAVLCEILTASEERPVFISTTDREPEMKDLLLACPYVELVAEAPSHHGRYNSQIWVARQHERNSK